MAAPSPHQLHFVLVPLMAQGHTIPMIEIGQLLAERGPLVTVITTPVNALRLRPYIKHLADSRLPIRFVELRFPCAETGLPEGCENIDLVPTMDLFHNFFTALGLLRHPFESLLREQNPSPSCIISDVLLSWTMDVARELQIPRFVFHGPSCFALLCYHNIRRNGLYESITHNNTVPFLVPGLPHRVEVTRSQAPGFHNLPGWEKFRDKLIKTEAASDGVLLNSFDDLEHHYIKSYQEAMGMKVWTVGPLSLTNRDVAGMAARGNHAVVDENRCLSWLDSMEQRSVIYVCFGSISYTGPSQLMEIGLGLEATGRPFIWVIKNSPEPEVEKWLADGFEERTSSKSLIIKGWAPQAVILSHPAIGGFVTHCGWNSTLEGVSAGVPMITWPHFSDQFLNEKLVVEFLKIGISMGVETPVSYVDRVDELQVRRDELEKAVRSLMEGGEEAENIRETAREYGEKAKKAMEEGGSSYVNITLLIECISQHAKKKKKKKQKI